MIMSYTEIFIIIIIHTYNDKLGEGSHDNTDKIFVAAMEIV